MKLTYHDPSYIRCSHCNIEKDNGIIGISQLRLNLRPAVDCCHFISFFCKGPFIINILKSSAI